MAFMFELVSELTWLSLSSGLHLVFLLDTSIRHTPTWVRASSSSSSPGPVVLHVSSHLWRSWTSCPAAVRDPPLSSVLPFLLSGNILIMFTRLYDTFHHSLRMPEHLAQRQRGAGIGGGLGVTGQLSRQRQTRQRPAGHFHCGS